MAETVTVSDEHEFVEHVVSNEDLEITDAGAAELWRLWTYRYENGATDDVLVCLQAWLAEKSFNKRWPCFFGSIEYDNPEKGAVLFDDARLIDINIVENEIWDEVTISEALELVDQTEKDEYPMDEKGEIWCPRSQMTVYERGD
jgi:hypothetical protein